VFVGSANNKLKLLLSFAVGCLLGDVFLHLLPEAWAHLDKRKLFVLSLTIAPCKLVHVSMYKVTSDY